MGWESYLLHIFANLGTRRPLSRHRGVVMTPFGVGDFWIHAPGEDDIQRSRFQSLHSAPSLIPIQIELRLNFRLTLKFWDCEASFWDAKQLYLGNASD